MQRDDIPTVMRVETAAYEFPWTSGIFRDCINVGHECWVLARGGRLLGHGVMSFGAGEAHLLNLCVSPAEQGQGHGRHLLRRLLDLARWHGTERVFLEVRPSNLAAIHLYHDAGFNQIGRRPGYYPAQRGREDALVLALEMLPAAGSR
ncbi:MAG TPA: ribosomal protein S18-alanine N-acetyltransferase [Rhodanobacteraceae bacterium]|nr:ribosomal protein S18-alanine N-acetyltransferase [Rhodanobacteraceae bacterium]